MKLIDFLHVPEDDELSVHDAGWDLLHPAGHLPQVRLAGREGKGLHKNREHASKKQLFLPLENVPRAHESPEINLKDGTLPKAWKTVFQKSPEVAVSPSE